VYLRRRKGDGGLREVVIEFANEQGLKN